MKNLLIFSTLMVVLTNFCHASSIPSLNEDSNLDQDREEVVVIPKRKFSMIDIHPCQELNSYLTRITKATHDFEQVDWQSNCSYFIVDDSLIAIMTAVRLMVNECGIPPNDICVFQNPVEFRDMFGQFQNPQVAVIDYSMNSEIDGEAVGNFIKETGLPIRISLCSATDFDKDAASQAARERLKDTYGENIFYKTDMDGLKKFILGVQLVEEDKDKNEPVNLESSFIIDDEETVDLDSSPPKSPSKRKASTAEPRKSTPSELKRVSPSVSNSQLNLGGTVMDEVDK